MSGIYSRLFLIKSVLVMKVASVGEFTVQDRMIYSRLFLIKSVMVMKVASVGESTVQHRISELRNTAAAAMTVAEYKEHARAALEQQKALEAAPPVPVRSLP